MLRALLGVLLFVFPAFLFFAVLPDEVLSDPVLEARARAISAELRCMVCQNQSIDDSNADLARDLRVLVRERLTAGDSDETGDRLCRLAVRRIRTAEAALQRPQRCCCGARRLYFPQAAAIAFALMRAGGGRRTRRFPRRRRPRSSGYSRRRRLFCRFRNITKFHLRTVTP
jgi:alkylhydroperoxidase family enzyme